MSLFSEERKMKIIEYIRHNSSASVTNLSLTFNVSESTVRRDLKELEDSRQIKRTHGGAILMQNVSFEPTFGEKQNEFSAEKRAIAKKAATFISDGDTILLDSGTTTYEMIKELYNYTNLTVVTNSINFMQDLDTVPGIDAMLLGGKLRRETFALVGPFAERSLSMIRIDKAFIATNGLDIEEGIITTPNLTEAGIKRMMIKNSKETFLLTDHSKIGKINFAKVADIKEIDTCIIDQQVPDIFHQKMVQYGVECHYVTI